MKTNVLMAINERPTRDSPEKNNEHSLLALFINKQILSSAPQTEWTSPNPDIFNTFYSN